MGNTVIEKIIRHNTGKDVKPGDIVTVNVDRVMIHDIFIPFVGDKFEEMGFTKLWDPDKVVLIYDNLDPGKPTSRGKCNFPCARHKQGNCKDPNPAFPPCRQGNGGSRTGYYL